MQVFYTRRYPLALLILFLGILPQDAICQNGSWTVTQTKPPPTYKGNLEAVINVKYGAVLLSKKIKGEFTQIGDHLWTETTSDGVSTWRELVRRNSYIRLVDSSGDKELELNLAEMQVNKVSKSGSGTSILHGIKDVREGIVPNNTDQSSIAKTNDNRVMVPVTENKPVENDPKQVVQNTAIVPHKETIQPAATDQTFDIPELNTTPVYHAILIAENNYHDISFNSLPGTVRDVRKIYDLLTTKYTFDPQNTDTLVNASRETILSILNARAKAMTENDNLFIFYAGHGWVKPYNDGSGKEEGFLIPCDAVKDDEVTFINSDDIVRIINRGSKAKHILFTADACFAGSLFRDIAADAPMTVRDAYKDKSRRLLSSGNRQAVSDESDFVEFLRLALQENRAKYITAEQLIDGFKNGYIEKTHMQLQYYPIQGVGDMGGQFVFMRR